MNNSCQCHTLIKTEDVVKEETDSIKQECIEDDATAAGGSLQDRHTRDAVKHIKLEPEDEDIKSDVIQTCYRCNKSLNNFESSDVTQSIVQDDTQRESDTVDSPDEQNERGETSQTKTNSENDVLLSCERCSFVVDSDSAMENHHIIHNTAKGEPYCCKICVYKTNSARYFNSHLLVHTNYYPHVCPSCDQRFKHQYHLYRHIKQIHPDSAFNCEDCDFSAAFSHVLDKHCKRMHPQNTNLIQCKTCLFIATSTESITLHQVVHKTEKGNAYVCEKCDYNSLKTSNFNRHILVHTGDRPYMCSHCISSFSDRNNLRRHLEIVHNDLSLSVSPHIKQYHSNNTSDKEMQIETDRPDLISCHICDFTATSTQSIDMHQIVHQPKVGKYYICKECGFNALDRGVYNDHVFVHTNDRQFICQQCNRCYKLKQHLRRHMRNVHQAGSSKL